MKTKEIRKEDIENLFEEYDIEIKGENFIDSLCNKINGYVSDILIEDYKDIMLKKAELLYYFRGMRPLQNLTPSSIILVFEHYWLTRSQYFWFLGCICSISSHILPLFERIRHNYPWSSI